MEMFLLDGTNSHTLGVIFTSMFFKLLILELAKTFFSIYETLELKKMGLKNFFGNTF